MSIRSGLAAQYGMAAETTYGTFATPTRFLEFESEGITLQKARIESRSLRASNLVQRSDRWADNKKGASGDVTFEVGTKGFGLLFKHMLGISTPAADGTGFKRSYTLGELMGLSFTAQIGTPDVSGTVQPRSYLGCKIAAWELSDAVDGIVMLRTTLDAQDETVAQALASASYPASFTNFNSLQGSMTIDGAAYDFQSFTLSGTNGLKTDRYFIKNSSLKKEPIRNALVGLSGSLGSEFIDLAAYNKFLNNTISSVVITYDSGITYDTAKDYRLVITLPAVRWDGTTPNVGGPDVVPQTLPFTVLNDGTNAPITIDYYTSDSSD